MKSFLAFLFLIGTAWSMPQEFQKVDPRYQLFTFSGSFQVHTNDDLIFVYESPHGHIYDGGIWGHEERMSIDFRRFVVELGPLHHVPLTFGMSYRTYPRDPYADSFQINRVETAIVSPRFYGFTIEYDIHALSNSGRQGAAAYWRIYFQSDDVRPIALMSVSYCQTNGLGWIARTPEARGIDYTKLDWGQMFGTGLFWSPSKGILANILFDFHAIGVNDYLEYKFEHFWNDDPTQPAQFGKNYSKHGLAYGNTYDIGRDLSMRVEGNAGIIGDVFMYGIRATVTLSTNFE